MNRVGIENYMSDVNFKFIPCFFPIFKTVKNVSQIFQNNAVLKESTKGNQLLTFHGSNLGLQVFVVHQRHRIVDHSVDELSLEFDDTVAHLPELIRQPIHRVDRLVNFKRLQGLSTKVG
jgi:hypothetical protein